MASIITAENYTVLRPGDKLSICWYIKTTEGYEGFKVSEGIVEDYSDSLDAKIALGVRITPENISVLLDPEGFADNEFLNGSNGKYLRFKLI